MKMISVATGAVLTLKVQVVGLMLALGLAATPARAQSAASPDARAVDDPADAVVAVTNAVGLLEWFTRPAGASGKAEDWIPTEGPPAPPRAYTWVTNQTDGSVTVIII